MEDQNMEFTLILTREARKGGGDRYEVDLPQEAKPWVVYVPQSITRPAGQPPLDAITLKIN